MNILANTFAAITAGALLATGALAQSAASLVVPIENEPAPRLFVDAPLPARQRRRLHPVPGGELSHPARGRPCRMRRVPSRRSSARFPNSGGWGYALFNYEAASDKFTADPSPSNCGHACHVAVKAKDYIFHPYQKR